MGISEALGPLLDEETPRRLSVQTPKRLNASPSGRLSVQPSERRDVQTPKRPGVEAFERPGLPLQATAKSKHPDFEKKTLYVRTATMRDAFRKYQDAGGVDQSDLVEMLLREYAKGGR